MENTKRLLIEHCKKYPCLEICDLFKLLYQSSFGCEHLVSSLDNAIKYITDEYGTKKKKSDASPEALDGDYSRVPLSYLDQGLSADTFGKLFLLSAKKEENGMAELLNKIDIAKKLIKEKKLPFEERDFERELDAWKNSGYTAVHHSKAFRDSYQPSYRVISNSFVPFLSLFSAIDKLLCDKKAIIAIEGGSASGKTTLGQLLEKVYGATLLHTDDFFLRPEQRTPERYAEAGGNFDRERFSEEVLQPLKRGEDISYRRFDCKSMTVSNGYPITPERLTIVEGAYSMHPELEKYYDLSVFLEISPELQKNRIARRNTPDIAKRHFEEWIPLENAYFEKTNARERCSLTVSITK